MPAESHHQRDDVTTSDVIDLLVAVLASSTDLTDVGPDTRLADLGINNELALFDLGDVVAEGRLGDTEIEDPVSSLVDQMASHGFDPTLRQQSTAADITMRTCPFESTALADPDSVCKRGIGDITAALDRVRSGTGDDADLGRIEERLSIITDANRCYLPVQERIVVSSILGAFPRRRRRPPRSAHASHRAHSCRPPKITDLDDGVVTYDSRQDRKQPDWTYEP